MSAIAGARPLVRDGRGGDCDLPPASGSLPEAGSFWLGLIPFGAYRRSSWPCRPCWRSSPRHGGTGRFAPANLDALAADPVILKTFWNSIWLSLLTAVIGAVVGAAVCYAMLGVPQTGVVRTIVDAASGVLAQFGGVMLAFAFHRHHRNPRSGHPRPGQVLRHRHLRQRRLDLRPSARSDRALPVLPGAADGDHVHPGDDGLEAGLGRGQSDPGWNPSNLLDPDRYPGLAPSFLASLLLLFANAFSSYATAAALASQGSQIVTLQIRTALTSETLLGRQNIAGVLALGMIVVVGLVMAAYSRHPAKGGAMAVLNPTIAPSTATRWVIAVLVGVAFIVPLLSTLLFTLRDNETGGYTLATGPGSSPRPMRRF